MKKDAKACVRVQGAGRRGTSSTVTTWGSTTAEILALGEHLLAEQVSCVVIESTSDYWKPFYYLLEEQLNVILVNAKAARNVPGRKTDVSDAAWLADLGAHGLVRASFVPPAPIRVLRDLTRARTIITRARTKEIQRLEKLLEDAGIKLSAVASNIVGVSGRAMLEALIAGERDQRCSPISPNEGCGPRFRRSPRRCVAGSPSITRLWRGCIWIASMPTTPISPAWMRASRRRSPPFNPSGSC